MLSVVQYAQVSVNTDVTIVKATKDVTMFFILVSLKSRV